MGTILIIDDDRAFLDLLRTYVRDHFPHLAVLTCENAVPCLPDITPDLDLILVDLEMPGLDGSKVLAYATSTGISKNRMVILSARDADYLHERFPMGSCLAVLNKHEAKQKEVLDMIFRSLDEKP
jgi:CheY-like chemotaxis protein